ncbi:hypothetical protein [Bacillus wiedmannii]|uniref:hypothetical protein n=1 Tax=Bacillus wiedmannii TaxID=1890302 RepID=UPI0015D4D283|nr:hypothetical protein [Bacillus wiedmannii]
MEIVFKLFLLTIDIVLLLGSFADEDRRSREMYFTGFMLTIVLTSGIFFFLD